MSRKSSKKVNHPKVSHHPKHMISDIGWVVIVAFFAVLAIIHLASPDLFQEAVSVSTSSDVLGQAIFSIGGPHATDLIIENEWIYYYGDSVWSEGWYFILSALATNYDGALQRARLVDSPSAYSPIENGFVSLHNGWFRVERVDGEFNFSNTQSCSSLMPVSVGNFKLSTCREFFAPCSSMNCILSSYDYVNPMGPSYIILQTFYSPVDANVVYSNFKESLRRSNLSYSVQTSIDGVEYVVINQTQNARFVWVSGTLMYDVTTPRDDAELFFYLI